MRSAAAKPGALSPLERRAAAALRFETKRRAFLAGRAAAHAAVAGLRPDLAPAATDRRLAILAAPDGAPEAWLDGVRLELSVSIAHRGDLAMAAAVSSPAVVGCDLEKIEARSPAFVADFLTGSEADSVARSTWPEFTSNLAWCAKEAVLKVRRTGLRRDTRSVEVALDEHCRIRPSDGDRTAASAWIPVSVTDLEQPDPVQAWWRVEAESVCVIAVWGSPAA